MVTKKPKLDPEILKRRNAERASANRERKRIEETHRESVLSMIAHDDYTSALYQPSVFRQGLHGPLGGLGHEAHALWRRQSAALAYVLGQRAQAVLTSFGVNPNVTIKEDTSIDTPVLACTNYKDIEIMINLHKVDFQNMESVADILLAVKGVVYHEGGHILHTLAFDTLFDCALMDNNVEPIVFNRYSDGRGVESMKNNYPAYLDDEVNFKSPYVSMELPTDKAISSTDTLEEVNLLKAGLSLHQHQFTKVKDWIRPAWNALEDGRMEDTLVRNTPTMAGYLEAVTLKLIVEPSRHPGATWPMVAARSHLSDDVYYLIRELAVDYLTVCGRSLTEIDECEKLVQNFRKATTPTEVVVASWQFANFLHKWSSGEEVAPRVPPGRGGHPNRTGQKSDTSQNPRGASTPGTHPYWDGGTGKEVVVQEKPRFEDEEINAKPVNKRPMPSSGDPQGGEKVDGSGGDGNHHSTTPRLSQTTGNDEGVNSTSVDRNAGARGTGGTVNDIKHNVDYEGLRNKLKNRIFESTRGLSTLQEAEQFMSDVNIQLSKPLIRTQATSVMDTKLINKAKKVANDMLSALAPLAVAADPAWRFRQETGVLDPIAYKTHEPGDSDYWIDYEGEGSTGHNLSVSVLLDTSGSMDAWMDELSVAAYGIRSACDSLGIPCTVSTFDTDAYMLYPSDEDVHPLHIHDGGGTNPRAALKQVENQRAGKDQQLVVVLTDGAWSDVKSIKPFTSPGQYWILIALGDGIYAGTYVEGKGANVALTINDVAKLPNKVEKALATFLA